MTQYISVKKSFDNYLAPAESTSSFKTFIENCVSGDAFINCTFYVADTYTTNVPQKNIMILTGSSIPGISVPSGVTFTNTVLMLNCVQSDAINVSQIKVGTGSDATTTVTFISDYGEVIDYAKVLTKPTHLILQNDFVCDSVVTATTSNPKVTLDASQLTRCDVQALYNLIVNESIILEKISEDNPINISSKKQFVQSNSKPLKIKLPCTLQLDSIASQSIIPFEFAGVQGKALKIVLDNIKQSVVKLDAEGTALVANDWSISATPTVDATSVGHAYIEIKDLKVDQMRFQQSSTPLQKVESTSKKLKLTHLIPPTSALKQIKFVTVEQYDKSKIDSTNLKDAASNTSSPITGAQYYNGWI